jgi:ribosomal protein L11 methyltransferase
MDWAEINIYTTTEGVDAVTGSLLNLGITGFVIKDSKDFEDFLENKTGNWDYIDDDLMGLKDCETTVTVYLSKDAEGIELFAAVKSELAALKSRDTEGAFGRLEYSTEDIREEDWANNWKQYFKPIEIGEKLLIKPSWEQAAPGEKRKILEIDPASSFGTGQHNTTRLCLELLERALEGGERILDLGCGSGILSIGALLLGAQAATAVDIDDNSVRIAAENAEKNGISRERYTALCGDITSNSALREQIGTGYDVVCANIVADVLIAMSGMFGGFLKPKGKLVVSGIIDARRDEVLETIKNAGFTLEENRNLDDWNAASFIKNT